MKRFNKILVSVDDRFEDDPALEWAIELAAEGAASLHLVDVVPDLSWLERIHQSRSREAQDELRNKKKQWLDSVAATAAGRGVEVSTEVTFGKASTRLIEMVSREKFDLLVRTTRGKFSRSHSFFGRTSMRLLRHCPSSVWLVKPDTRPHFEQVAAAVDLESTDMPANPVPGQNVSLDREILELARSIAQHHSGHCHVIHAWDMFGSNLLRSRMDENEFEALEHDFRENLKERMAKLADSCGLRTGTDHIHLVHGDPAQIIPEFIRREKIDLAVMGTHTRTGLSNLVIGNTAEQILDKIQCSLLAMKPVI